jgi:hypothetical protein
MPTINYTPQQLQEGALISDTMGAGKIQVFSTFGNFPPNFNHSQSLYQYFTFETKKNSTGSYDNNTQRAAWGSWYQHSTGENIIKNTEGSGGDIKPIYVNSVIVTREIGTSAGDQWRFVPKVTVPRNTVLIRGTGDVGLNIITTI